MLGLGASPRVEIGLLLRPDLFVGPVDRPGIEEDDLLARFGERARIDIEGNEDSGGHHSGQQSGNPVAMRARAPEFAQILHEGAGAGGAGQWHGGKIMHRRLRRQPRRRFTIDGFGAMIRTVTRFLAFLLALTALAAPASAEDRHYAVEDFDRVIAEGPYVIRFVTGRTTTAVAHGSREALDRMSLDVQGQMLRIRRNRGAWAATGGADPGTVTIDLVTRSLRSVRLIGPVRFDAVNVRGLRVELSVEGSGTLHATGLNVDALSLALLGSGTLDIAGAARTLAATFQGTGDLAARTLVAHNANINSTTSGAVALTVNGPATIVNNGVGNVRILGRPVCTITGSAADQVRCGGSDQGENR